jgi:hypothetical protein
MTANAMKTALHTSILAAVLFTGGCGSMGNTPAQETTWAAMRACDRFPGVSITRVEPDGKYWVKQNNSGSWQRFQECVRQQRVDTSKAHFAAASAKDLLYRAYFVQQGPPSGTLKEPPAERTEFRVGRPVTFYYVVWQSDRALQAKFAWYGPDGTLAHQQDRTLRDSTTAGTTRTWFVQTLPSIQVQQPGAWALDFFIDDQLMGRYKFTATD